MNKEPSVAFMSNIMFAAQQSETNYFHLNMAQRKKFVSDCMDSIRTFFDSVLIQSCLFKAFPVSQNEVDILVFYVSLVDIATISTGKENVETVVAELVDRPECVTHWSGKCKSLLFRVCRDIEYDYKTIRPKDGKCRMISVRIQLGNPDTRNVIEESRMTFWVSTRRHVHSSMIHLHEKMQRLYNDHPRAIGHLIKTVDAQLDTIERKACAWCSQTKSKNSKCKRCKAVYYCSTKCQKSHWPKHKSRCKKCPKHITVY